MKKFLSILSIIIASISFVSAQQQDDEQDNIQIEQDDVIVQSGANQETGDNQQLITTKELREIRCQEKQQIKAKALNLYKELKSIHNKELKKEIKNQIANCKKELWILNTKIAYSYKQELKKLLFLK